MRTCDCPAFFDAAPMGRREFLRAGSLVLLGLTLPQVQALDQLQREGLDAHYEQE